MKRWIVAQVEPQKEHAVRDELARGAYPFEAFLPIEEPRLGRDPRTKKPVVVNAGKLLIRGYLFVETDLDEEPWGEIVHTRGVLRLLPAGAQKPLPVRRSIMDALLATDITYRGMTLGSMLAAQRRKPKVARFQQGDHVRVTLGGEDRLAEVKRDDGGDRLRVILGWLEVDVPAEKVRAA